MEEHQTEILNSEHLPQFFKIYMPEHCSTQLRIPPAFIKFFEGCLPLKFILVNSLGMSWEVDMNKIDDDVYLKSGWEKFALDNSLVFGDFLIFYYNGGSRFYVSISGINNCLKEIEAANERSEKQPPIIQGNDINEIGDQQSRDFVEDTTLSFKVTMSQTYITMGFLNTPTEFYKSVKTYRPTAKLQHSGRTWDVKVVQDGERLRFKQGWGLFVKENCLILGDVCCFKIIDIQSEFYLLDVSFSRDL